MTEQLQTLVPSPAALGEYIQEHVLQGYRLKDGWPIAYSWQYEVIMEKASNVPDIPMPSSSRNTEAPKKAVGRPKAA